MSLGLYDRRRQQSLSELIYFAQKVGKDAATKTPMLFLLFCLKHTTLGSVCTPRLAKGRTVHNGIRSTGRLTEKRTPEVRTGLTRAVIHTA